MWKKLGWVFVGIYTVFMLSLNIIAVVKYSSFSAGMILSTLVSLFPAIVIALELALKKMAKAISIILALPALLMAAVFFLGSIKFNSMSLETLGKGLLFGITMILLVFLAVKRVAKKKEVEK